MKRFARLISLFASVAVFAVVEMKIRLYFGLSPDFSLLFLLAIIPQLSLLEVVLVTGFSGFFFLFSTPLETSWIVFMLFPIAERLFRRPGRSFMLVVLAVSTFAFYAITAPREAYSEFQTLFLLAGMNFLFGMFVMYAGEAIWGRRDASLWLER